MVLSWAGGSGPGRCGGVGAFRGGGRAVGEVVGTEFVVGLPGGQDVPDDHDQGVGDHDDGFLLGELAAVAAPFHYVPVVEGFEVAVVAGRGPGALDQDGLQVLVAFAPPAGAPPPG